MIYIKINTFGKSLYILLIVIQGSIVTVDIFKIDKGRYIINLIDGGWNGIRGREG